MLLPKNPPTNQCIHKLKKKKFFSKKKDGELLMSYLRDIFSTLSQALENLFVIFKVNISKHLSCFLICS